MNRCYIVLGAVLMSVIFCRCNPDGEGYGIGASNVNTKDFQFGYYKDNDTPSSVLDQMKKLLKFLSFTDEQERTFISFLSCEELDDLRSGKYKGYISNPKHLKSEMVDTDEYKNSFVEWSDGAYFEVKPFPTGGKILSVDITSSNEDIIKILGPARSSSGAVKQPERIYYYCKGIGTDTLTVDVKGLGFHRVRKYPVDVVATIKTKFIITNRTIAASNKGCRLWMAFTHVPPPASGTVVKVTDSVTVTAYAEYFNFHKHGRALQTFRDTVALRSKSMYFLPSITRVWLLRELSLPYIKLQGLHYCCNFPALPNFAPFVPPLYRTVPGERINRYEIPFYDSDHQQIGFHTVLDTVAVSEIVNVDQTNLSLKMACDNPYVLFENSSFTFLSKDMSEYDMEGSTVGKDSVGMMVDNLDGKITKSDSEHPLDGGEIELDGQVYRNPVSYFNIELFIQMSKHERDSVKSVIDDFKRDSGYSDSVKDSQDDACHYQDSVLNKINYRDVD